MTLGGAIEQVDGWFFSVGREKCDGQWMVKHEHHSLRMPDERFIDDTTRAK
jgi:hypothetical protein